jgi:hypothetical protein
MLRRPHAHHRGLRARLPAAAPTFGDSRRHQNRHLMITATRLQQRRADLPSPWSSTGCDDTHSNAPCQQQNEPARATLGGYPNYQDLPLPPTTCVIARPSAHCDPSNAPSSSLKSARQVPRTISRGFVPWRLSDAGHCSLGTIPSRPAFAVGTAVTSRPPHRSVRAQFGHTAPTSSV